MIRKNKISLWGMLLGIVFLTACSIFKSASEAEPKSEVVQEFNEETIALSFERTVCFGTCPSYKILVQHSGDCLYEGFEFVEKTGKYTAKLDKEQLTAIQEEAERIGYFEMQDEYDADITDVPSVLIMISGPNGPKSIMDRAEAPEQLKQFERYIDSILLNLDWKKAE